MGTATAFSATAAAVGTTAAGTVAALAPSAAAVGTSAAGTVAALAPSAAAVGASAAGTVAALAPSAAAAGASAAGTVAALAPSAAAAGASAAGTVAAVGTSAAGTVAALAPTVAAVGTTAAGTIVRVVDLKGRKIVVGTEAAYPPFESVDATTNQIVGFDIDLFKAVAERINVQLEFQNVAFDTIFAALQQKQYDAVISSASITAERARIVAFSEPYINVGQVVVTLKSNTTIANYTDLASAAAVGVQTGTTGETAALEEGKVPDAKLKRYISIDLAFIDLVNNAIDAVVADSPTVWNYVAQPQFATKIQIVGEPFTTESYGIAVQQGDTVLLSAINAALVQIEADGTLAQLKAKYKIQ